MSRTEERYWAGVVVNSRSEVKVAKGLTGKGFEVFLPLYQVLRQWSDRMQKVAVPLFTCHVFCRLSPRDREMIERTPGVFHIITADGKPVEISGEVIEEIKELLVHGIPALESKALIAGQPVRLRNQLGASQVRGTFVEPEGEGCRIALEVPGLGKSAAFVVPRDMLLPA